MRKLFLTLSVVALMLVSACSDSTSSTSSAPPETAVEMPQLTTSISANHTDQYALSTKEMVESLAQSFISADVYTDLGNYNWEQNGNTWTYSETQDGITVTLTVTESTDGYLMIVDISGTDPETGITYSGKFLEIYTAKDGKSGYWKMYSIYSTSTGMLMFSMDWSVDANGTATITAQLYNDDGSVYSKTDVTINSDGSGTYSVTNSGTLVESATWNADGSGSITYYYSDPPTTYTWGPNPA